MNVQREEGEYEAVNSLGEARLVRDFALLRCKSPDGYSGDDCAVMRISDDLWIVLTIDAGPRRNLMTELGVASPFEIGYYSATMTLSDIASMGACEPRLVAAIVMTPDTRVRDFELCLEGISSACEDVGGQYVGGDTKEGDSFRVISSGYGSCRGYRPMGRKGARPGDFVFVSGPLGKVIASMIVAARCKLADVAAHSPLARPTASVRMGFALAQKLIATACCDMSDGPVRSAEEIGRASRVCIELHAEKLPVVQNPGSPCLNDDWFQWILETGGGDFGLLFTVPAAMASEAEALGAVQCGIVRDYENYGKFSCIPGYSRELKPWEHFTSHSSPYRPSNFVML